MTKAYFAISFSDRKKFDKEIAHLVDKASQSDIEIFVFVDKYHFGDNQEKEMMQVAFDTIDKSDFLIAELTHKSIGVGIEVGYAHAKKKPIIYIRKKGSAYSTTTAGCADFSLEYDTELDLTQQVLKIITSSITKKA